MWIALKCTVCGRESADNDLDPIEFDAERDNIQTDEHGQVLEICDDCI